MIKLLLSDFSTISYLKISSFRMRCSYDTLPLHMSTQWDCGVGDWDILLSLSWDSWKKWYLVYHCQKVRCNQTMGSWTRVYVTGRLMGRSLWLSGQECTVRRRMTTALLDVVNKYMFEFKDLPHTSILIWLIKTLEHHTCKGDELVLSTVCLSSFIIEVIIDRHFPVSQQTGSIWPSTWNSLCRQRNRVEFVEFARIDVHATASEDMCMRSLNSGTARTNRSSRCSRKFMSIQRKSLCSRKNGNRWTEPNL